MRDKTANLIGPASPATASPASTSKTRAGGKVAVLVCDGLTMFEFGVACDVFGDSHVGDLGVEWYELSVCAATRSVTVEGGLRLEAGQGLRALAAADTVVVPPTGPWECVPEELLRALRRAHARGARMVSLCTGAFVLAAAGLLDGRCATTHWTECAQLAESYPCVSVDPSVLYVDEGDILTSAGSAASIDLCLHVVRADYGAEIANRLARQLVVAPHRAGGQAQYIEAPVPAGESLDLFADTMGWMREHLREPMSVADLARRSAMSRRTFARRFAASTGTTPYQWLLNQRLQLARELLESSDMPMARVAESSGFATAPNLRKHFARTLRTSPQAYRETFNGVRASQIGETARR